MPTFSATNRANRRLTSHHGCAPSPPCGETADGALPIRRCSRGLWVCAASIYALCRPLNAKCVAVSGYPACALSSRCSLAPPFQREVEASLAARARWFRRSLLSGRSAHRVFCRKVDWLFLLGVCLCCACSYRPSPKSSYPADREIWRLYNLISILLATSDGTAPRSATLQPNVPSLCACS